MIRLDSEDISFPDPEFYDSEDGLIAIGGDLKPERLWFAYQLGLFPWYNEGEEILWWCPDPRFVLFPNEIKVSKSMRKILRDEVFEFTENQCFEEVMRNCKTLERKGQDGTWINEQLIKSFIKLHHYGKAKSFEVWQNSELVGGFYGVQVGNVFCGESMFSKVSNASKAGFIYFTTKYKNVWELIDCQIYSEHLESLGGKMIPKIDYLNILKQQKP
ncbi:leucyl/phenylalanyl-tRNA--protein transferase [Epilithonimonas arachidiradicis]|uniref:Leucyl/phenylalanyl-tRNA--protein transferase n=1 Tax=Epilithonimonas arachidiradicis TaxID=1617282 RepID=A0A420DE20_9FLAO|nr:leucyl/phenylalanyl-tRNA--protein transferase [Epilithonimonas arachidiradicis]RKE90131.1 leucyl/phenylalanyl-tRNA--protein transferase [Epilithonimonas arachidiradicis]GGG47977.1 leucyl/phenylalanyl-tRNA--protein transferase [Epilithonimonas arachidiradicis]